MEASLPCCMSLWSSICTCLSLRIYYSTALKSQLFLAILTRQKHSDEGVGVEEKRKILREVVQSVWYNAKRHCRTLSRLLSEYMKEKLHISVAVEWLIYNLDSLLCETDCSHLLQYFMVAF